MDISLIPIGRIDKEILEALQKGLSDSLRREIVLGSPLPEPDYALSQRRGQYLATPIIRALMEREAYGNSERVLGIADHDLFVPDLNFVFGVARGRVALISLTRLRQEFYGLPGDRDIFMKRVLVEAIHELGHTFGLEHCRNPRCVMFFSSSIEDTDRKGSRFCPLCRRRLSFRPGETATLPEASLE